MDGFFHILYYSLPYYQLTHYQSELIFHFFLYMSFNIYGYIASHITATLYDVQMGRSLYYCCNL